ncbi:MAG: hypothetical protein M3290_06275 [Actinomycetota bacterium]|nr:hypothetical protein [Actinomycetota bacterium]
MASINATAGPSDGRPPLAVVDASWSGAAHGRLHRLAARLLDRATLAMTRDRQRAELGALRASTDVGRDTGARC